MVGRVTLLLQPPDAMSRYVVTAAQVPTTNAQMPAAMLPGSPSAKFVANSERTQSRNERVCDDENVAIHD